MSMMAYKIGADPDSAKLEILAALRAAEGSREEAARTLGTSIRTFYRWLEILRMYEDVDNLLREMNLDVYVGPPRKYHKDSTVAVPKTPYVRGTGRPVRAKVAS